MKQKLLKVQYIFINKTSLAQKIYYLETHRFYDLPEYDNLHIPMSLDTTDLIFIQLVHLSSSCSTKFFVGGSLSMLGITPTSITFVILKGRYLAKFNMTK